MHRFFKHRPSPALVVASVALVISLGSGAYAAISIPANSVGAAQLRDGAVTSAKLRNHSVMASKVSTHSLLAKDFMPGQLPAGPRGLQGPPGVAGAKGDPGATSVRVYYSNTVNVQALTQAAANVNCPAGTTVTGGGWAFQQSTEFKGTYVVSDQPIVGTYPILGGATPTGWGVTLENDQASGTLPFRSYVLCASP